ncbi:hypothetical protein QVD17_34074 [Tagetes erecta]|uniref:Uncharacterized protein n=1 Tax=Tagetes erecta TaxID=13708 RepID=A0AAD8NLL7_TARER|nr:hypothetical protein QVD17_34074 [Tagetes erecta]
MEVVIKKIAMERKKRGSLEIAGKKYHSGSVSKGVANGSAWPFHVTTKKIIQAIFNSSKCSALDLEEFKQFPIHQFIL